MVGASQRGAEDEDEVLMMCPWLYMTTGAGSCQEEGRTNEKLAPHVDGEGGIRQEHEAPP